MSTRIKAYKNSTTKPTIRHNSTTYRINNGGGDDDLPVFSKDLGRMIDVLEDCYRRFGRVLMVRVDLHTPLITANHADISRFMKNFSRTIERKFNHRIGSVWCAEFHGDSKSVHYHLALFLNGNTFRTAQKLKPIIRRLWEHPAGGYLAKFETEEQLGLKKKRHSMVIESKDLLHEAIYWLSYLAKVRGKLARQKGSPDYRTSHIKPKNPKFTI